MKRTVYLAGPIMECTHSQANDWRIDIARLLARDDIRGVSPLRCEPLLGERYAMAHADPKFGTARAIAAKNMLDVRMCDMLLAFIPKPGDNGIHSLGTISELAWAHWEGKPTILVSDDPYIQGHPVIGANAGWILDNLDDAYEVIVGVLGGYTIGGKKRMTESAGDSFATYLCGENDKSPPPDPRGWTELKLGKTGDPKKEAGANKPSMNNVSPVAEFYEGAVMDGGAITYGEYNWGEHPVGAKTYYNAIRRHLAQWWLGDNCDASSGLPHLAHIRACCGILIDQQERSVMIDNRPKNLASIEEAFARIGEAK